MTMPDRELLQAIAPAIKKIDPAKLQQPPVLQLDEKTVRLLETIKPAISKIRNLTGKALEHEDSGVVQK